MSMWRDFNTNQFHLNIAYRGLRNLTSKIQQEIARNRLFFVALGSRQHFCSFHKCPLTFKLLADSCPSIPLRYSHLQGYTCEELVKSVSLELHGSLLGSFGSFLGIMSWHHFCNSKVKKQRSSPTATPCCHGDFARWTPHAAIGGRGPQHSVVFA